VNLLRYFALQRTLRNIFGLFAVVITISVIMPRIITISRLKPMANYLYDLYAVQDHVLK
jgi:hypothetical protein